MARNSFGQLVRGMLDTAPRPSSAIGSSGRFSMLRSAHVLVCVPRQARASLRRTHTPLALKGWNVGTESSSRPVTASPLCEHDRPLPCAAVVCGNLGQNEHYWLVGTHQSIATCCVGPLRSENERHTFGRHDRQRQTRRREPCANEPCTDLSSISCSFEEPRMRIRIPRKSLKAWDNGITSY
jgi:hypothetical protein